MITAEPRLYRGDVDEVVLDRARAQGEVAWDIETTGLDWRSDDIRTCQLAVGEDVSIVQLGDWGVPDNLRSLLQDPAVLKVFHHAPFDLRFMAHHWKAEPVNVACTKIASKVLDPHAESAAHSLKPVLKRYLNVSIDKTQQRSDWSREVLTGEQLSYAAADVQFLSGLMAVMRHRAEQRAVIDLLRASYEYLPTRVKLDLLGSGDVFTY